MSPEAEDMARELRRIHYTQGVEVGSIVPPVKQKNQYIGWLKEAGTFLMGILILLAMVVTVVAGVMNHADWLKWLNIF